MIVSDPPSLHQNPLPSIEAWARSAALEELVLAFDGDPHAGRDLHAWLAYLDDFSCVWDFRGANERNLARTSDLSQDVESLVFAAAARLGLRGVQSPPVGHYQHLVILGGLVSACLGRTLYAAQILHDGAVTAERVVALATARPLRGDEVTLSACWFARQVDDEHEAMCASVESAFGVASPVDVRVCRGGAVTTEYLTPADVPVHVINAQRLDPSRSRANTADTYAWLANESGWVLPGDAALLITTDIYVPFQHADAVRMLTLPHGISVDFAGIELGAVDPRLAQSLSACNYLQEIRSTIRSLRMLSRAATPEPLLHRASQRVRAARGCCRSRPAESPYM